MQPPLFILSPPRSFTTVTCAMLGNHPEMFGLAETNLFAAETLSELARLFRWRPRFRHGLLRSLAELGFAEQSEETVEAAKAWLAENEELSTAEVFTILAEWAGPRTVIDKSPLHVYAAGALQRMQRGFADAYYLHLTRHPAGMLASSAEIRDKLLDVAEFMEGIIGVKPNLAIGNGDIDPEKAWLKPHFNIMEFLEGVEPGRQIRLKGEDVLENPRRYLAEICEWLGRRYDEPAMTAMLHPEQSPFAAKGPRNARFGNDPKFMDSPKLRPYQYKPLPLDIVSLSGKRVTLSGDIGECARIFGY
ncbi:MAG: sulfotransferase [Rhodospirillales bacterium]|nr:sulfotransferase [Rhodospirillales bacterium]